MSAPNVQATLPPEPKQDIALCLNTRNRIRSGDEALDADTASVTLALTDLVQSTRMHYISVVSVEAPRAQRTIEEPCNRIYFSNGYLFDVEEQVQLVDRTFTVRENLENDCRGGTCGRTLTAEIPIEVNLITEITAVPGLTGFARYVTQFPHALDVIDSYDWGAPITINVDASANAAEAVPLSSEDIVLFRDDPFAFEAPFVQGIVAGTAVLRSPTIPTPQDLAAVVSAALRVATERDGGNFARPGPHGCLHPCPVYTVVYGPPDCGRVNNDHTRDTLLTGGCGPPRYAFTLQATCAAPVGTCVLGFGKLAAVLGFGSGSLGTRFENKGDTLLQGTWDPPPLPSIALPAGNYDLSSLAGAISREFNRFYLPRTAEPKHALYISALGSAPQEVDLTPGLTDPEVLTAHEYAAHVQARIGAVPTLPAIGVRWEPTNDSGAGYFRFISEVTSAPGDPVVQPRYALIFSHRLSTAHSTLGFLPLDQTGWHTYKSTQAIQSSPTHYPVAADPLGAKNNLGFITQVAVKGSTGGICLAAARPVGEVNPPATPGGGPLNLYLGVSANQGTCLTIGADVLGFEPKPQTWQAFAGPLTSSMPAALGGPAYLLMEITTGANEQTFVHHASMKGDKAPTKVAAKIVIGQHGLRMERYYPMTLELSKGARANQIMVRLLTPDHELYNLHGRDWSLTLLVGSALPDTMLGFKWA